MSLPTMDAPANTLAHSAATSIQPARNRDGARWRWWAAAAGMLAGLADAVFLTAFGLSFAINGHDATLFVGVYFGASFAVLGFLLGSVFEARRRDARAAALIQSQTETIDAARARLVQSEKLAALGQLAAAVAHEVRNPLAVIRSAAQGVAESLPGANDDETRRACSFITAEIDRLSSVVTSLLAFARPLQLAPHPVPVHHLFDRALLLAQHELALKHVALRRQEQPGLPVVHADTDLISQVLLGLLANAVEAVPPHGEVSLEARVVEGGVELDVADSGPGVPCELRARIFEPFFTTRSRGTGLGLAVARQIVDAHRGRIEVGERAGGGARFTVFLPTAGDAAIAA
jgi:two-component system NtrC family sensor kinase